MLTLHAHTPSSLDPRTRLAAIFVPVTLIGATLNPISLLVLTIVALGLALLTKLAPADVRRVWIPLLVFCLVTLVMHLLFVHPREGAAVNIGPVALHEQAIKSGLLYCWRIVLFAALALSFARWITQEEFVESVWRLMLPFGKLGVPVQGIGMSLTIAIRFLPQIVAEHRRIETAQRARGARRSGSWLTRTRQLIPTFVPTMASAFRRIQSTADALTVRGWAVYPTRTFLRKGSLGLADIALLAGLVVMVIVLVVI